MTQPVLLRVTRSYDFPAERVFDAWLDPKLAREWLFTTPDGEMVRAEVDPRVGGKFCFVDRRAGEDVAHVGEYLEIDRPRRLVFTFGVPKYSPDFERVTVEIRARGEGCELILTHELHDATFSRDQVEAGWTGILAGLARSLA